MKGKFGAAELQFLTKAIDTAIAVGGKVIGAVERSQMDKGITGDAVKAAALQAEPSGLGGQKAMDAVSRAKADAAAGLAAGTLAPGPATYAMEQEASSAPTPVATKDVVAVQEVGRPIVAVRGAPAPERAALLARMEGAHADFGSEWASSSGLAAQLGELYGLTPRHEAPSRPYFDLQGLPSEYQLGPLADALGRAQALVHHANETGDARHLDPARKLYEGIIESGVLTDEQHAAVIDSEPFKAAFSAEWWGGSQEAGAPGSIAAAIERAQALEAQAKESGNPDYLSEAWSVYDDISSGRHGALTDEQRSALIASPLINSAPFRAAFVGDLPEVGGATAPTAAAPVAQQVSQAAPQQQVVMSAEEALFRQRRQLAERERQRAAAFLPQNLRRMRPGQLQAILRFAKTPQEAAAVMGAIRRAPEVQPMGVGDVLGGGHITRAQDRAAKGWRPPRAQAPASEFEQSMALARHNAWLRESQARAAANQALTDKRRAAIQADLDESAADAARRARALKNRRPRDSAKEDAYSFYVANWAKHDRGEMTDADWGAGAGSLASVGPAGLRRWAEANRLSRATRRSANKDASLLIRMRKPRERAGVRTLLTASDIRLRENNIVKYEREEANSRGKVNVLRTHLSKSDQELEQAGHSRAAIQAEIGRLLRNADIAAEAAQSNRDALGADQSAKSRGAATQPAGTVYTMDDIDALAEESQ
jgi:hypothetical protein